MSPAFGPEFGHDRRVPFGMGFGELVLILVIVVVVFGSTRLPELGDGLGDAIQRFREQRQRAPLPRLLLRRGAERRRWSRSDWLRLLVAFAAVSAVIVNAILRTTGGR
jgi:TatA/E family protein of Tat protein translocase